MQVVTMEVVMVMMMRNEDKRVLVCADDCDIFLLVRVK